MPVQVESRPDVAAAVARHPRLEALVEKARRQGADRAIGLVYPCDRLALEAACRMQADGIAKPVLIGPRAAIEAAAATHGFDISAMRCIDVAEPPIESARRACAMARAGELAALMKGSLHTDELMSAVVDREHGLRGTTRISHAFVFDLPRYPKLLAVADCVVNIAPALAVKRDIIGNAITMLQRLGIARPKVGIVAAVETVNPSIPATLDARDLVEAARAGAWPGAIVEGPFGFDNVISSEAARIKHIESQVSGDADLLVVPDLNAGNMLYKSFVYIGGGDCAGLVLGARVPIVLTSRADSALARIASVALAVLVSAPPAATAQ